MATQPAFASSIIRFCAGLIASIIVLISIAPAATAQTTWTVVIDVSSGKAKPKYEVSPAHTNTGACPISVPQVVPGALLACPNDTVLFTAKIATSGPQPAYDLYVYPEDPILPVSVIHVTNGDSNGKGGKIASLTGTHKYRVALIDSANGRVYVDDPQIVIGSGHGIDDLDAIANEIKTEANELHVSPLESTDATNKAIKQAEQALADLQKLEDLLKAK